MADRERTSTPLVESATMVGEHDADAGGWTARDWVPGPAGTVAVTLPGGVELDIDVATPSTFVGLWVEEVTRGAPSDEGMDSLTALLGIERAGQLVSLEPGGSRQLRGYDEVSRLRNRRDPGRGTFDPEEPGVAAALGRHALAIDQSVTPGASDLVRALALIDAAAAGSELTRLGFDGRVRSAATEGVALLLGLWPDVDPVDRDLLADRLRRVLPHVGSSQARRSARRLLRELDDEGDVVGLATRSMDRALASPELAAAPPRARPMAASAPAPVARLRDVDVSTLAPSYEVTSVAARATTESEAEVRLPGRADLAERLWARAHDRDGTVLAASRFVLADDDAVARLLIPPAALTGVALDVTDRPADPLPSSRLRSMLDAVDHGRAAARADRLRDRKEQFARWGRSSASWDRAGDADRARTARQFAEDGGQRRIPEPLLADPIVDAGA